jgi:hypothetical protein
MKIELEIPDFKPTEGIRYEWQTGFIIETKIENDTVIIRANSAGLISIAKQLLTLAQSEIPHGYHLHYDEGNSLEDGSGEIIIEKI